MGFRDRTEAGQLLADRLVKYAGRGNMLVLALPRGGLPVGFEIAKTLDVPLDVFLVRKLGSPANPELALGAVAEGGGVVLNKEVIRSQRISEEEVQRIIERERAELERRARLYRGERPAVSVEGKEVILVDDGLATGSTMRVSALAVRQRHPARIIVAAPVAPPETRAMLRRDADEVICLLTPMVFMSVGSWYERFEQTTDDEVRAILREAALRTEPAMSE